MPPKAKPVSVALLSIANEHPWQRRRINSGALQHRVEAPVLERAQRQATIPDELLRRTTPWEVL